MADIPVPRSYEQIVSDIVDAFIARTGISALKVGSPLRSMMEAVAQSQFRGSQDTFNLLEAASLDHATGDALTQIAADEGLVRKNASASFGYVTFTDKAFTKISSQLVYQTAAGQTNITLLDATGFTGGAVIIDGEEYAISTIAGNTITLGSALVKTLGQGTEVVFKQGNARTIPAGTSVGTGTTNFTTVNSVTIPAGEVSVSSVAVVCATEGTSGNVTALSINVINSTVAGLTNPTVSNPLPFINGQDQETDDQLRDRVRYAKYNKQKATPAAVQNAVIGVQSPTDSGESKKVISASIYDVGEGKASLYIDDGTGYEPITSSVGIETLTASATGGEKYFELQGGRPVAQCFIETGATFPADLSAATFLTVEVEGVAAPTLNIDVNEAFVNPLKATSYELVSYINRKAIENSLPFRAATRENHSKVVIFPEADNANTIAVTDCSDNLGFVKNYPVSTLYLFRNGVIQLEGPDYTLNRNKGQIYLTHELKPFESLVVGSVDIRAGIITGKDIPTTNTTYINQYLWFVADDSVTRPFHKTTETITQYTVTNNILTFELTGSFGDVQDGDWLIAWGGSQFFVKKIFSPSNDTISVRSDVNLSTISGFEVFHFSNTERVPQQLQIPRYNGIDGSVDSLVYKVQTAPYNSLAKDIHVERFGSFDKVEFFTNSFQSTGGLRFLTGTAPVVDDFGLEWSDDTNTNPTNYQTSLVSNPDTQYVDEEDKTVLWPNTTTGDVGKISVFVTGQQRGLRATQPDVSQYRYQLQDSITSGSAPATVLYELVDTYSGFHLSDTDTVTIRVDGDSGKVYECLLSIPASIGALGALTTQDGGVFPFTKSLNDWAIWSAGNQTAQPSTGSGSDLITFTSKMYGPANHISRINYVYPSVKNSSIGYTIGTEIVGGSERTLMSVILPSGAEVVPSNIDDTQKVWVSEANLATHKLTATCVFSGTATRDNAVGSEIYFTHNNDFLDLIKEQDYVYVQIDGGVPLGNFYVNSATGDGSMITINLEDPDNLIPFDVITNVFFSVSKNPSAASLASFSVINGGTLMHHSQEGNSSSKTYYISDGSGATGRTVKFTSSNDDVNYYSVWTGANVKFFQRDTTTPTYIDTDYFKMENPNNYVVAKSSEDILNFTNVTDDGLVFVDERINYVKAASSTVVVPKIPATQLPGLVKFVPVTAQNVADCLNYQLQSSGVEAVVSSGGHVELVRIEAGADSSVEVTGGSGNLASVPVTILGSTYCTVSASNALPFVEAHWVQVTDGTRTSSPTKIDKILAFPDSVCMVIFEDAISDYASYTQTSIKLVALNKLGFPENTPATNSDGYKYYSGLLGEVNKVVYGDLADPVNYPGYASANANIEVTAPQVKRIPLNIYVRMQNGFTLSGATLAIRNAAATAVNSTPVGQDVAYSDIISAINAISGVFSVAIAGHTETNPTIPVLAYEKPLVINLEGDINVTITGI